MYEKVILCLANSRRPSGRCVAGKVYEAGVTTGQWIRPVSVRVSHDVSDEERSYKGGGKAQLLDIITVPLLRVAPNGHQVENHTLDQGFFWRKEGTATLEQVIAAVDPYDLNASKFWMYSQSTYHGLNDKVAESHLADVGCSLKLIAVCDLAIRVKSESGYEGSPARRRVRAKFTFRGQHYLLSITDSDIEAEYLKRDDGAYEVGQAVLCVSLAEVWNGFSFRVVASVIIPSRWKGAQ